MAWTTPKTWNVGDVLTAADMNTYVRDNIAFVGGTAGGVIPTSEATSSTAYTDLTTPGPAVTVTTGVHALVILTASVFSSAAANGSGNNDTFYAFAVSGATTTAPNDGIALRIAPSTANTVMAVTAVFDVDLTAGANTFTAKYRVLGGTANWTNRNMAIVPLP